MKKKADLPRFGVARMAKARKKSLSKAQATVATNRLLKRSTI